MKELLKVVIVGEPLTGKTSIRKRYMGLGFSPSYLPTMGSDYAVVNLEQDHEDSIVLEIWDLAGQESFEPLIPNFISHSNGALFVFDLTRKPTFLKLRNWIKKFRDHNLDKFNQIPLFLIGNKSDLPNPVVTTDDVRQFKDSLILEFELDENLISFYFTSALTGDNIKHIFDELITILN